MKLPRLKVGVVVANVVLAIKGVAVGWLGGQELTKNVSAVQSGRSDSSLQPKSGTFNRAIQYPPKWIKTQWGRAAGRFQYNDYIFVFAIYFYLS